MDIDEILNIGFDDNLYLLPLLERCCSGLDAEPLEVIEKLLRPGHLKDLKTGLVEEHTIVAHIKDWIDHGKQKNN